jgi:transposase-like protein
MFCTHCGSKHYVKNGKYKGYQRYRCNNCHRYFSDKVRKFTFADKVRAIDLLLMNTGVRNTAKIIGCSHPLIIRWIREFAGNLRRELQKSEQYLSSEQLPDIIEMDEIYTRVKKGLVESKYGLLILAGEVKLLRL